MPNFYSLQLKANYSNFSDLLSSKACAHHTLGKIPGLPVIKFRDVGLKYRAKYVVSAWPKALKAYGPSVNARAWIFL
jgi:hypothetical protein